MDNKEVPSRKGHINITKIYFKFLWRFTENGPKHPLLQFRLESKATGYIAPPPKEKMCFFSPASFTFLGVLGGRVLAWSMATCRRGGGGGPFGFMGLESLRRRPVFMPWNKSTEW